MKKILQITFCLAYAKENKLYKDGSALCTAYMFEFRTALEEKCLGSDFLIKKSGALTTELSLLSFKISDFPLDPITLEGVLLKKLKSCFQIHKWSY